MQYSHAGAVGRAEGRQQAARAVPDDPHVPPPVASEGQAAAVRRGAARRAPAGGARGANGSPVADGATGPWEDALALTAGDSAHDDTQPLAGGGRLCSDELLALARTGLQQCSLRHRHGTFGGRPLTLWDFTKRTGVHWLHELDFNTLFVGAGNYSRSCPSIDEITLQNARNSGARPMSKKKLNAKFAFQPYS